MPEPPHSKLPSDSNENEDDDRYALLGAYPVEKPTAEERETKKLLKLPEVQRGKLNHCRELWMLIHGVVQLL